METEEPNFEKYYNLESYLLDEVGRNFRQSGKLTPLDFFFILIWKANRSKTRTKKRLIRQAGDFSSAVQQIAAALSIRKQPKEKLELLMRTWGFRLPTATAILTILYPADFTVYDVRVSESLNGFRSLNERAFSDKLWGEYCSFKVKVELAAPAHLSLRDKDRYLWGKSFYRDAKAQCA
jgi:hypothetical protein